ncbi:unnamed protein product [Allacma fusca]|uniref:Uncharacterized protein n=1 Tax=Allacma fusca TaxID=39272 RepID=A0A8J2L949_9HEXA|nr:unnamed protein product [Allacma fusca]
MHTPKLLYKNARGKPTEGGHVNQKGTAGPKTPTMAVKNGNKNKTVNGKQPPSAQKTQVKNAAPEKKNLSVSNKNVSNNNVINKKNNKKGHKHQQYDVVVTIDLVSLIHT